MRTILQCLWNLQRHTKIPVTKAKTKMPAKSLMSCDRLIVCIKCRSTNRPELVFNLCEERMHIPTVIITYELRLQFIYHIEVDSVLIVVRVLVCTVRNFVQPVTTCDDMQNI